MADRPIAVFGGTGFLGRRVVRRLLEAGLSVRVASRHPQQATALFPAAPLLQSVAADIGDRDETATALQGAGGVVNAVSLYVQRGGATFRSVHVEAAGRLAQLAGEAGVERLVQISGIGADASSTSPYIRSRGEGEAAVLAAFPGASIIRPAVMFGEDDALIVPLARMLRRLPVFALFGGGETRLQPAWVEDVAAAVARAAEAPLPVSELAGPQVLSFRQLVEMICRAIGRRPLLMPLPFEAWQPLAWLAERLPEPPITRNQVELMRHDNIASGTAPGFAELGMAPRPLRELLPSILAGHR